MCKDLIELRYTTVMPQDGPWLIEIGEAGLRTFVGPFLDSDGVVSWVKEHGDGQPVNVHTLFHPDDYPGASLGPSKGPHVDEATPPPPVDAC